MKVDETPKGVAGVSATSAKRKSRESHKMFNRKKSAYADRVFISPRELFGTTLTLIDFERWEYEGKPRGVLVVKELPTGKISCSGTMCRQLDEVEKTDLPAMIKIEEYEQKTYKPGQHKAIRIVDANE